MSDWEWMDVKVAAAEMGISVVTFHERAEKYGWKDEGQRWSAENPHGVWRPREKRGGGYQFHYSILDTVPRMRWERRHRPKTEETQKKRVKTTAAAQTMWTRFDALTDKAKARAQKRLAALIAVQNYVVGGMPKTMAVQIAGGQLGFGKSSFHEWEWMVAGVSRDNWLPYLADHNLGGTATAEMSPEAWDMIKADYLRPEKPSVAGCYRRLVDANEEQNLGWVIPSQKTVARRLAREKFQEDCARRLERRNQRLARQKLQET